MRTRTSPRVRDRLALVLLLVAAILPGCSYYFLDADPVPELYIHESFWDESIDDWDTGVRAGFSPDYLFLNGRLEVYGPRHFLITREVFDPEITVLVEWSATNGDIAANPHPLPVVGHPDFTIARDDYGVAVELDLYEPDGVGGFDNALRLVDLSGQLLADPAVVKPNSSTSGRFYAEFSSIGDQLVVSAKSPELGLEFLASVPNERGSSTVTITASGRASDPRSLEEIYVYRRRGQLEDAL